MVECDVLLLTVYLCIFVYGSLSCVIFDCVFLSMVHCFVLFVGNITRKYGIIFSIAYLQLDDTVSTTKQSSYKAYEWWRGRVVLSGN